MTLKPISKWLKCLLEDLVCILLRRWLYTLTRLRFWKKYIHGKCMLLCLRVPYLSSGFLCIHSRYLLPNSFLFSLDTECKFRFILNPNTSIPLTLSLLLLLLPLLLLSYTSTCKSFISRSSCWASAQPLTPQATAAAVQVIPSARSRCKERVQVLPGLKSAKTALFVDSSIYMWHDDYINNYICT